MLAACAGLSSAQVLARPGWAGANASLESWWKRGVFYRIEPSRFQASQDANTGDLAGIAMRLGYLQSLGVDAIVLRPPAGGTLDPAGFDALARAAYGARLRVMVEIGALDAPPHDTDAAYLATARNWLTQGAAGLFVDTPALTAAVGDDRAAKMLHALRALTNSFPGERILLAAAVSDDHDAVAKAVHQNAQLIMSAPLQPDGLNVTSLRTQMEAALGATSPNQPGTKQTSTRRKGTPGEAPAADASTAKPAEAGENLNGLLGANFATLPADATDEQRNALNATLATILLGSRDAVLLDAGQEIGLAPLAGGKLPLMQWTPSNITPAPAPPEPAETETTPKPPAPPPDPNNYGAFKPYVPPSPVKKKPAVSLDEPIKVDPNTQPGFTSGTLPNGLSEPADRATKINVATEDADPNSLLNFYRRLIQYHHGNALLRSGTEDIFNHDTLHALTWLRRLQANAARSPAMLVICNLSDKPVVLSFSDDFKHLQIRPGSFRTLVTSSAKQIFPQAYDHVSLPAYSIYLGEMYH